MVRVAQSLKGSDPMWRGMSENTALSPAATPLKVATNVVVSRDGTELRPAPGTRLAGKPFYGQSFVVTVKAVGGGVTTLTVNATADGDGDAYLPGAFWVYVPADSAIYAGIRTGIATFTIPTITSAVIVTNYVLIRRYSMAHDMSTVDGRAAVVAETTAWRGVTTEEQRNLATMVCSGPLSLTSPPGPGIPNETDTGFVMWPSPTAFPMNTTEHRHGLSATHYLRHYDILRRMQCDPINGRLLIAVPGLGIMFEANVRLATQWMPRDAVTALWQPDIRWTRMLGIPRGVLSGAAVPETSGGSLSRERWYAFAVAYYNPLTDEVGLMSPLRVVLTGGTAPGADDRSFDVQFLRPRGAMMEAVGLQSIVYLAGPFDDEATAQSATLEPKLYALGGPFPTASDATEDDASSNASVITQPVVTQPDDLPTVRPRTIGVIEVNPPGASWVRAVRARPLCGGERPAYWDISAWPHTEVVVTGEPAVNFLVLPNGWEPVGGLFLAPAFGPAALRRIPPSFAGRTITQIEFATYSNGGLIESIANAKVTAAAALVGPTVLRVNFNAGTTTTWDATTLKRYRIHARQQATNFAEEAVPSSAPSTNELPIDALSDRFTTGGARIGDQALICTLHQTHLFGWAALPSFASSSVISNRFGCASAHSVCEFPMGAAWLSARGPCVSAGGPPIWIGEALVDTWEDVLKDSEGMVICAGVAVDEESSTIFWAVRRSTSGAWAAATTDALKARVPCDTVIAWNWASRALSIFERPTDIACLKSMLFDDAVWRPTIASAVDADTSLFTEPRYQPLYALSGHVERGTTVSEFTATATRDPDTSLFACADADDVLLVGDYAFVRSANGDTLRWFGTIATVTGFGPTLSDTDGVGWIAEGAADVLVARGPAHATITTHRAKLAAPGQHTSIDVITIVARVDADYAYAKVTATANDGTTITWPAARLTDGVTELSGNAFGDDVAISIEVISSGAYGIKDVIIGGEASNV